MALSQRKAAKASWGTAQNEQNCTQTQLEWGTQTGLAPGVLDAISVVIFGVL